MEAPGSLECCRRFNADIDDYKFLYEMEKNRISCPWFASIVSASDANKYKESKFMPKVRLELLIIYGHESEYNCNNIFYNSVGEVVYSASSVGVIYDRKTNSQQFFRKHNSLN